MTRSQPSKQAQRNLIIFALVTISAGWIGFAINQATEAPDPQQGLGTLLFLILPPGTGLLLRAFGGDGWHDMGLRPNLRSGWPWYVAALLIFPIVSAILFGVGLLAGAFTAEGFARQGFGAFVSLAAVAFISALVKNIFEELAWRSYLTPRFEALGLHPLLNHLLTGTIWASWHIPYWLFFIDVGQFSKLGTPGFIAVAVPTLIVTAITYGELRLLSQSVWPVVILHSLANAVTATFLLNGFINLQGGLGVAFSPGNDGIIHSILFALVGVGLYVYRKRYAPKPGVIAAN